MEIRYKNQYRLLLGKANESIYITVDETCRREEQKRLDVAVKNIESKYKVKVSCAILDKSVRVVPIVSKGEWRTIEKFEKAMGGFLNDEWGECTYDDKLFIIEQCLNKFTTNPNDIGYGKHKTTNRRSDKESCLKIK